MTVQQLSLPLWRTETPKPETRWHFARFHRHSDDALFEYIDSIQKRWLLAGARYHQCRYERDRRSHVLTMKEMKHEHHAVVIELSERYAYDRLAGK